MKHSERFTNAVTKLYNAFHNGTLDSNDCKMCAVGNICDNNNGWIYLIDGKFGSGRLTNDKLTLAIGNRSIKHTGYSPLEIITIERIFVSNNLNEKGKIFKGNKETQFKGLCDVIEYLCELEGIPNIMDYQKLFESAENKLEEVFV